MAQASETEGSGLKPDIDYTRQLTVDLRNVLKQQREVLRSQGFRLPPGTTTTLNDIAKRLEVASSRVGALERDQCPRYAGSPDHRPRYL